MAKTEEMKVKELRVRLTFCEEILGTASANTEIHTDFIASKAPDAPSMEEEIEAIGKEAVEAKAMTVFPKEDGVPFIWDYQIRGFFKDACGVLRKVGGSESSKIKAYKKEIDGLVFVNERKIPFIGISTSDIGECQRPLRGQTAQGERIALAHSETVPAGTTVEFTITCLKGDLMKAVTEWLDYGKLRGLGQWRNSGKGRFTWEEIELSE